MPEEVLHWPPPQEVELRGCELPHHNGAKKWSPVPKRLLRGFIHTSPCPRALVTTLHSWAAHSAF